MVKKRKDDAGYEKSDIMEQKASPNKKQKVSHKESKPPERTIDSSEANSASPDVVFVDDIRHRTVAFKATSTLPSTSFAACKKTEATATLPSTSFAACKKTEAHSASPDVVFVADIRHRKRTIKATSTLPSTSFAACKKTEATTTLHSTSFAPCMKTEATATLLSTSFAACKKTEAHSASPDVVFVADIGHRKRTFNATATLPSTSFAACKKTEAHSASPDVIFVADIRHRKRTIKATSTLPSTSFAACKKTEATATLHSTSFAPCKKTEATATLLSTSFAPCKKTEATATLPSTSFAPCKKTEATATLPSTSFAPCKKTEATATLPSTSFAACKKTEAHSASPDVVFVADIRHRKRTIKATSTLPSTSFAACIKSEAPATLPWTTFAWKNRIPAIAFSAKNPKSVLAAKYGNGMRMLFSNDLLAEQFLDTGPPDDCSLPGKSVFDNVYLSPTVPRKTTGLRPVILDGSSVAMAHGNGKFSSQGLEMCVNYFCEKRHQVIAILPKYRQTDKSTIDRHIIVKLIKSGHVVLAPSRKVQGKLQIPYDDRYLLQCAYEMGGVVVSNDEFRDFRREKYLSEIVENRVLNFNWVDKGLLMFPSYPRGVGDSALRKFLRFPVELPSG